MLFLGNKRKYDQLVKNHWLYGKKEFIDDIAKSKFEDNISFEKKIQKLSDEYEPSFTEEVLKDYEELDNLLSIFSYELQDIDKLKILLKYFKFDKNTLIKAIERYVDCEYDGEEDIDFLEKLLKLFKLENKEIEHINIIKFNHLPTIKLLMKYGYKPTDDDLHTCCIYLNTELLEFLLKDCKLDPNTKCSNGWTPMHHAYQNVQPYEKDSDMIKMLIKYGGDPNIRDEIGKLPIDIKIDVFQNNFQDVYK